MRQTLLSVAKGFFFLFVDYLKTLVNKSPFKPTGWLKLLVLYLDKTFCYMLMNTIV